MDDWISPEKPCFPCKLELASNPERRRILRNTENQGPVSYLFLLLLLLPMSPLLMLKMMTQRKRQTSQPKFLTLSVLPFSSVGGKWSAGRMYMYQKEKSKCLSYFIQSPHSPGKNKIHVQVQAIEYKLYNVSGST